MSTSSPILLIAFLSSNCYFDLRMVSRNNKNATVQHGGSTQPLTVRPQVDSLLLRGGEVAALLGVSRALAFRWTQECVLPTVRIAGARTVRVPKTALLEWIEQNTGTGLAPSQPIAATRASHAAPPASTSRRGGARNAFRG